MLKKLVKYGNSSALVLDKALLELLNIAEGSVVKIKTDGVSLIITPQNVTGKENVTKPITPQETLQEAVQQNMTKYCRDEDNIHAYMNELNRVFAQYRDSLKKITTPEMQQALEDLEHRFNNNRLDPEYIKAMLALRQQCAPELEQMDQEVRAISQKYALPEYQYTDKENKGKLTSLVLDFKKVHEKYRHVQEQVIKLNENPDYIHESVLLAEKYQAIKNSPEYIKEYVELVSKYIPEYSAYQHEIKIVAESWK